MKPGKLPVNSTPLPTSVPHFVEAFPRPVLPQSRPPYLLGDRSELPPVSVGHRLWPLLRPCPGPTGYYTLLYEAEGKEGLRWKSPRRWVADP